MIYSGTDLIRTAGQQQDRFEQLQARSVPPPSASEKLSADSQGALLRFAKFVHNEKRKKKKGAPQGPTIYPRQALKSYRPSSSERGLLLDIFI